MLQPAPVLGEASHALAAYLLTLGVCFIASQATANANSPMLGALPLLNN